MKNNTFYILGLLLISIMYACTAIKKAVVAAPLAGNIPHKTVLALGRDTTIYISKNAAAQALYFTMKNTSQDTIYVSVWGNRCVPTLLGETRLFAPNAQIVSTLQLPLPISYDYDWGRIEFRRLNEQKSTAQKIKIFIRD
jgi:hypothetical protein